jgi:L-threonylcarbamoyladenylate synthase
MVEFPANRKQIPKYVWNKNIEKKLYSSTSCTSDFLEIGNGVLQGKTIVFPTDTVYGLGSSPFSQVGTRRCLELKKRPEEKKFPVLTTSLIEASKIVRMDERARLIARRFWPGQLTLILPCSDPRLPETLLSKDRTLAVRVPNHQCCLRLIAACGNSLIGTSANISGSSAFVDPDDPHLLDFARDADYFVKGNCGGSNSPSTILDVSKKDKISVVREGRIPSGVVLDYLENTSKTDFSFSATTI